MAFDTDSAGAKATLNALELAENDGMDARVVRLVGAKDPDEAVKQDIKIWQDAKAKAVPVMTYRLQSILSAHDLTSSLGKQQSAKEALTLIARLESEVSRMHYLQQLGEALKVSQDTLQVELQRLKIIPSRARPVANIDTGDIPKLPAIEKEFMTLVVQNPTLIKALSQLNLNWISSPEIRHILEELMRQDANSFQFEAFYANVGTTEQKILAEAVFVPLQLDFAPEVVFAKLHDRLEYGYIKDRLTAIPKDIARAEIADDEATIVALQHEQQQLTVRREQLELDRI